MARRKKHMKLPNHFGSIKYLGKGRRRPYAVYPPVTEWSVSGPVTPPALGNFITRVCSRFLFIFGISWFLKYLIVI